MQVSPRRWLLKTLIADAVIVKEYLPGEPLWRADGERGQSTERTLMTSSINDVTSVPDFQALFPYTAPCSPEGRCYDCDACDELSDLTPRNALALWFEATSTFRQYTRTLANFKDGETAEDNEVFWNLPPVCEQADKVWLTRYAQCFSAIAERLARGEVPYPRCTADEMAIHTLFGEIEYSLEAYEEGVRELSYFEREYYGLKLAAETLPADPDDLDVEMLQNALLEDTDVLMLFDYGIDDLVSSGAAAAMGMANLDLQQWFLPFYGDDTIDLDTPEVIEIDWSQLENQEWLQP